VTAVAGWRQAAWAAAAVASLACGPARAQLVIRGGDAGATHDCAGGDAQVVGNASRVVVAGSCRTLGVFGSGNAVVVDLRPDAAVQVTGDRNRVAYRPASGAPSVAVTGHGNVVQPATPAELATLPPPGPLVIPAGALSGSFGCGGRDVVIHASYSRYELFGGCRSVTVDGTSTTVLAELLPGAPLAVGAAGVAINYLLVEDGPPPSVRVTVPGERATHIQRTGGSLLQLPTVQLPTVQSLAVRLPTGRAAQ